MLWFSGLCNNFSQLPKKRDSKILMHLVVVVKFSVLTYKNICATFFRGFNLHQKAGNQSIHLL